MIEELDLHIWEGEGGACQLTEANGNTTTYSGCTLVLERGEYGDGTGPVFAYVSPTTDRGATINGEAGYANTFAQLAEGPVRLETV